MFDPIPVEAVQPEATPTDCNGQLHAYSSMKGPHSPVFIDRCYVCGEIGWTDLAEQVDKLREQERAVERARIAEDLRQLGDWPNGYRRFRAFIEDNGLVQPERPLFSAFLLALADMIRQGDDA